MSKPKPKSFDISKRAVWEAWLRVKANKGAAGVDEQSIEEFERDLHGNLYKLWNRLSSGSYMPPPVRAVQIPKRTGSGVRTLGVPTVAFGDTLSFWRERFFQKLGEVQKLGFDERFQRMWDFYLAWCEGAFRERYINVAHLLLTKTGTRKILLGDPILGKAEAELKSGRG